MLVPGTWVVNQCPTLDDTFFAVSAILHTELTTAIVDLEAC